MIGLKYRARFPTNEKQDQNQAHLVRVVFFFPRFEQVTCNCYEDSSRRFLLLWLVGVITLVLVSQESFENRWQTSSLAFNARCWSFAISKASFECSLSPWITFKCCCKSYELKEKDNWTIENLKVLSMLFDWTFHTPNTKKGPMKLRWVV